MQELQGRSQQQQDQPVLNHPSFGQASETQDHPQSNITKAVIENHSYNPFVDNMSSEDEIETTPNGTKKETGENNEQGNFVAPINSSSGNALTVSMPYRPPFIEYLSLPLFQLTLVLVNFLFPFNTCKVILKLKITIKRNLLRYVQLLFIQQWR